MTKKVNLVILGAGDFGSALILLWAKKYQADKNLTIKVWEKFSPARKLPDNVLLSKNLKSVLKNSNIVVNALPSKFLQLYLPAIRAARPKFFINVAKGLANSQTISQQIKLPRSTVYAVLAGPNIASQLVVNLTKPKAKAKKFPAVLATDKKSYATLKNILNFPPYLSLQHSPDVLGVEWSGVLKQLYATAFCYLSAKNKIGEKILLKNINTEIKTILQTLNCQPQTFVSTPAGLADLVATCQFGRHGQVGKMLAGGQNLKIILRKKDYKNLELKTIIPVIKKLIKKHRLKLPVAEELLAKVA